MTDSDFVTFNDAASGGSKTHMTDASEEDSVFMKALWAAADAFHATIDGALRSHDDRYRESARLLREGAGVRLRTGLIDADFVCWHSELADKNFAEEAAR